MQRLRWILESLHLTKDRDFEGEKISKWCFAAARH